MELLFSLLTQTASLLLFTHDLRSVKTHCERVVVMYGGVVEQHQGQIFSRPAPIYQGACKGRNQRTIGQRIRLFQAGLSILRRPSSMRICPTLSMGS